MSTRGRFFYFTQHIYNEDHRLKHVLTSGAAGRSLNTHSPRPPGAIGLAHSHPSNDDRYSARNATIHSQAPHPELPGKLKDKDPAIVSSRTSEQSMLRHRIESEDPYQSYR